MRLVELVCFVSGCLDTPAQSSLFIALNSYDAPAGSIVLNWTYKDQQGQTAVHQCILNPLISNYLISQPPKCIRLAVCGRLLLKPLLKQ